MLLVTGLILALGTASAGDNRPSEVSVTPAQAAAAQHTMRMDSQGVSFLKRMQQTQVFRSMQAQRLTPMTMMAAGSPVFDRLSVADAEPDPRTRENP